MDSLAPALFFILLACALAAFAKLRGKPQEQEDSDDGLTPKQRAQKKQAELEEIVRVERLRHRFKERHDNPPKPETYGD